MTLRKFLKSKGAPKDTLKVISGWLKHFPKYVDQLIILLDPLSNNMFEIRRPAVVPPSHQGETFLLEGSFLAPEEETELKLELKDQGFNHIYS